MIKEDERVDEEEEGGPVEGVESDGFAVLVHGGDAEVEDEDDGGVED